MPQADFDLTAAASDLPAFLTIGAILPTLLAEAPDPIDIDTPVLRAIAWIRDEGYSCVAVQDGGEIAGLFSVEIFTDQLIYLAGDESVTRIDDTATVDEYMDHRPQTISADDTVYDALKILTVQSSALVTGPGISVASAITLGQLATFLGGLTLPFVLIHEIEVGLRQIATAQFGDQLEACIRRALKHRYSETDVPARADQLSFYELVLLVVHGENYKLLATVFGANRDNTRLRLAPLSDIRNTVFHFRRELDGGELQRLQRVRDWLQARQNRADRRLQIV